MRIDSGLLDVMTEVVSSQKPKGASAKTVQSAGADRLDTAVLTDDHDEVKALSAQVSRLPDVREKKVETLRASLQQREYRVSPEDIAAAMYRDVYPANYAASNTNMPRA